MRRIARLGLLTQILIAFVIAVILGIVFGPAINVVQPLGDLFLRLIKFIIVPLILSTLVMGVASTGDIKKLGRIGSKTIGYFLITTFGAVSIGLILGSIFSPGKGVNISVPSEAAPPPETEGVINILLNIIPTNPIAALAEANILQIIFFAIFIGLGITMVGKKAQPLQDFFIGLSEVMLKITGIIMKFAPIGIFGLMAPIIGEYGASVLLPLIKLVLSVGVACILHAVVIYSFTVKTFGKMSPIKFFKGILPASVVAFSTQSSSGTLPVSMKNCEDNLGVSNEVSSFVLPLGATINMDGTAIYMGVATLFIAQFYSVSLTFEQFLLVILIATLGSIGTAGVPGAGLVMLTMVLTAVNLPLEGIALIAGVDRFLDMFRTSVNVTGDASAAVIINTSENKLNVALEQSSNKVV
ncbi:MAG TPA: dicarboxylate/amino acid:cation symporter [Bacillus bacterium]|uniref:Dicarboxylate:amino acid:cation symporter DAACS family protein n=1 Tax=Siminovitchia fordii TaxID=254759 RepID=A0ABQ4K101_9BACI|nr:dicarboxylate/amino acid:cation symporter [Siminovitchia fordii]GIN19429.1 dicarboxylate:amino acid:cation symporter DAACS family protein [Siminovitchia fordii]HBZ09977.1 dicarboxylate/amino acid:cation symporter [Bacillus sp. (in: firmicutes)]